MPTTVDLVPVPDGLNAEETEAVIVNGVTARRMLADAKVDNGANGGVASRRHLPSCANSVPSRSTATAT